MTELATSFGSGVYIGSGASLAGKTAVLKSTPDGPEWIKALFSVSEGWKTLPISDFKVIVPLTYAAPRKA